MLSSNASSGVAGFSRAAREIALEIPFDAFNDHVLSFLEPDLRDYYDSEERWVQIQTFVAERLEAAR
jgi:hypothetical protein